MWIFYPVSVKNCFLLPVLPSPLSGVTASWWDIKLTWDRQHSLPTHLSVTLGGPRTHQSLDMSIPGLESSGLCGCSCCESHSTPQNILVNPFLNLFPSCYFWDEDRCALCGAIPHSWSASTISVAVSPVFYPIPVTLVKMPITSAAENWSTTGLQGTCQPPAGILAVGDNCATLVFLVQSWLQEQIPGQAGYRERIQRGRCLKDKHFWDHQLFPHKFNGRTIIFFPPACQSCEMNVTLFMLPRLTTMSFAFTGCPA